MPREVLRFSGFASHQAWALRASARASIPGKATASSSRRCWVRCQAMAFLPTVPKDKTGGSDAARSGFEQDSPLGESIDISSLLFSSLVTLGALRFRCALTRFAVTARRFAVSPLCCW